MSVTKADLIEALKSLIFPDTKMREALREELASPRVIVDYGYGYKCSVYVSLQGEVVFNVFNSVYPPPAGKSWVNKVFMLEGFSKPVEIGDLYALDSRNQSSGCQPFITLDGSVLIDTCNILPSFSWMALWRYNGVSWSKVYEDTGANMHKVEHFSQDPATRAIYGGYRNNLNSRVIKSVDDGVTWSLVYSNVEINIGNAYIYGCAAFNNNVILTKRDKHTYIRSANGGIAWIESAVLPLNMRIVNILYGLELSFITSDNYVYYSRDYFVTYKRIMIRSGTGGWVFRYPIRVGGRLLLSAASMAGTVFLASRDLYHTVTPVFSVESESQRIAGYGDYLLVGNERYGALIRVTLPKTLERGFSCPIMLWEGQSVPDTINGLSTDYIETEYNDKKTFYIYSTQAGTLYVQAYDEVGATYRNIDSIAIAATTLTPYQTTYGARLMRLLFIPSVAATVSAWAVLE